MEDLDLGVSNSIRPGGEEAAVGDTPPQSSQSVRTPKSGRRGSALNAFGMAAQKIAGQRASILAVSGFMKGGDAQADSQVEDSAEAGQESPSHSKSLRGGAVADQAPEIARRKSRRTTTMFNALSAAAKAQARANLADEDLDLGVSNSMRPAGAAEDASQSQSLGDTPPTSSQSMRMPSKPGRRHSALSTFGTAARRLSGQRASILAVSGFMKGGDARPSQQPEESAESGQESPTRTKSLRGNPEQPELVRRKERRTSTVLGSLSSAPSAQAKLRAARTLADEDLDLSIGISNSMRTAGTEDAVGEEPPTSSQSLRTPKSGRRHSAITFEDQ